MAETPEEMLAKKIAIAVLAALRNPPPETIEAGAKAMWVADRPHLSEQRAIDLWGAHDQRTRNAFMHAWLASWRAAIDGKSDLTDSSVT